MAQESNETLLLNPAEVAIDKHVLIQRMAEWLANPANISSNQPLLLLDVRPTTGPKAGERVGIAGIFQGYDSGNRTIQLNGDILESIKSTNPEYRWNYRIPWDVPLDGPFDFWASIRIITFNEFLWNVSDTAGAASGWFNGNQSLAWPIGFITANQQSASPVYQDQQHFKCVSVVFSDLANQIFTPESVYEDGNVPIEDINCCGGGNG